MSFYRDTPDMDPAARRAADRIDADAFEAERDRWDADESFWRIDTWSDAQLADEQRFGHYMQNAHKHKGGK
jgi:hypothetical protein